MAVRCVVVGVEAGVGVEVDMGVGVVCTLVALLGWIGVESRSGTETEDGGCVVTTGAIAKGVTVTLGALVVG